MNIELKPCPFCGGKAEARISPNSRSDAGASFYEVRCKECGVCITGEKFNFWVVKYDKEKPQDLLSAVERWNKRAYEENGRKMGKWKRGGYCCGETEWICPNCNASEWRTNRVPFCPWCGNPMEVDK